MQSIISWKSCECSMQSRIKYETYVGKKSVSAAILSENPLFILMKLITYDALVYHKIIADYIKLITYVLLLSN